VATHFLLVAALTLPLDLVLAISLMRFSVAADNADLVPVNAEVKTP
jgi:hypothetical protein